MTRSTIEKNLITYRDRLKHLYPHQIKKMILFGSAARGETKDDSDIDILMVVKDKKVLENRIYDLVIDILLSKGPYISTKIYNESEYNKLNRPRTFFMKRVAAEGKNLW